ncbi:MAG: hypothetical protein ABIJ95_11690 [Pseudomonadota bacterium]
MERSIIHLNVADFAVAVERACQPRLRGLPVIVASSGAARASVYDMSDEAFSAGVRKGMPLFQARRACPDAALVEPRPGAYVRAMEDLSAPGLSFSPLLESGQGDGHLFVDVTGTSRLHGPAVDVAWRLGKHAKNLLGLSPAWSVAPNKLVAKAATRVVKPRGECIVGAGEEESFLAPLALFLVPGLEAPDLAALHRFNLSTAGEAAAWTPDQLWVPFGNRAFFLHDAVRGRDASPVLPPGARPPAVAEAREFSPDTNDREVLEGALYALCEQAGARLRAMGRASGGARLSLEYADAVRTPRQAGIKPASACDPILFAAASRALAAAWTRRVRVRKMTLVLDRLDFFPAQMELFPDPGALRMERLCAVLDRVRERFGPRALQNGRTLEAT